MDMDFLSDPIFSDLDRSDFIGGIDNEALDFGHLEQFMQVAAAVGSIEEGTTNNNNNSNHSSTNISENTSANDPKIESPTTPPTTIANDVNVTISAHVSLTTTPIATPLAVSDTQATPQLPESPPDSGSEHPYSPLQDSHGLTLTSRDYNVLPGIHQASSALHDIHMQQSPQFTPPHHHSFSHNLQNHLNTSHGTLAEDSARSGIRVKHEAGLLMNPANLSHQLAAHSPLNPIHSNASNETHIEIPGHQLLYPHGNAGNFVHYESMTGALYPAVMGSYQNIGHIEQTSPSCMLTTVSDASRVQVVGTSQANQQLHRTSAPSTPVHHSSSRKRKLSTQLDCSEFANIKPDPGLSMSPTGSSNTPLHPLAGTAETQQKLGPTSPVSINMPTPNHDLSNTPAHSAASLSPALSTVNSNAENSMDGSASNNNNANSNSSGEQADGNALTTCIRFSPFQPQNWHKLCDQNLQELSVVYYRVDADKGFNFSVSDDAFVCQKKNHFQITCHARLQGDAKFVKTPSGLEKIKSFHLHFYGVKHEAPNQTIRVEQSQSDRSKKPFYPVPIDLQSHIVSKITVGRLHFSETTNNNMRKKGRPNPEQRYFQLVVGLHVHTMSGNFPVISQGSERIIVRASNPGQFESDVDLCWQRGLTQDSIFHMGRVGINTDRPDESLVVHGNLKVSGHIVQPSDSRAKQEIGELDTSVQLRNLQKIRIVRYRYEPEFAIHSGLKRASESDSEEIVDTGVIAQEVREVIPDAVQEAGSIVLPNGNVIENFLLVNKDRILMENIGAVKELCKVTGSLETRIEHLERVNTRLARAKDIEQKSLQQYKIKPDPMLQNGYEMCSNRTLQIIIFLLVIIMAACLAAVSTLYFVEHNKKHHSYKELESLQLLNNGHYYGHDSGLVGDEERRWLNSNKNKTYPHWPNFLISSATTTRPPAAARNGTNKSRQELSYKESGEVYTTHARNDELTVVMEKPLVNLQPLQSLKEPYKITTTAPQITRNNNNKTISSKNKSKWPLPQVVLRAAGIQAGTHAANNLRENESNNSNDAFAQETKLEDSGVNKSETSSEKVSETIPLPQDFENNSIDVDAQHVTKKPSATNKVAATHLRSSLSDVASRESALLAENADSDIALKLAEHIADDAIVSTSSSNGLSIQTDTTATAAISNRKHAYKPVSPPTATLGHTTTNKVTDDDVHSNYSYSIESPPISNKSHGVLDSGNPADTADALDLQNLSNNNDSVDNPITALFGFEFEGARESSIGRRSPSQRSVEWITRRTVQVEAFGAPEQCTQKTMRDDVSNCQSACFEDSNQLPILRADSLTAEQTATKQIHEHHQQSVDADEDEDENDDDENENENENDHEESDSSADINEESVKFQITPIIGSNNITKITIAGKNAHATQSIAKQSPIEQHGEDASHSFEKFLDHSLSEEHLANSDIEPIVNDKNSSPVPPHISIAAHRSPAPDCWKISSCLLAEHLNKTFGQEDFCPNIGKSLNLTYIIPLSRFFKESSIELHLSSSTALQWTICNSHEHTKLNGKHLITSQQEYTNSNLQTRQNISILQFNIPSRGYFIRDLSLRATNDLDKQNICQEKAHEANTLLQYNFRILRDCD